MHYCDLSPIAANTSPYVATVHAESQSSVNSRLAAAPYAPPCSHA